MSLSVKKIIEILTPQFSGDGRLNDLIFLSKLQTSNNFGDKYNLAVALRVCHWLTKDAIAGGDAGSDPVTTSGSGESTTNVISKKEGKLSVSYGSISNSNMYGSGDLNSTVYGMRLIDLIKGSFFKPRTRFSTTDG